MFRNFIKIAFRNLYRNKGFSFINISGLAIGMASAMFILLWVQNEVSFDRFHSKQDRLYEIWSNDNVDNHIRSIPPTPEIMAPILKKDYPEIEEVSRVSWDQGLLMVVGEKQLQVTGNMVDPGFLKMFSFPLLKGNIETALSEPSSILITENLSRKLFGNEDPMGKTIRINNNSEFKVTGLLKNLPNNTLFDFEFLTSYLFAESIDGVDKDWTDISVRTFALLKPNASLASINSKIKDVIPRYSKNNASTQEFLYPVSELRLRSEFENGKAVGGRIETVRTFGIIAIFILLIACINFMNLSTARSEKRAKEVGIRKVSGAGKKSLIGQFIGESILVALIAGAIAILIVQLLLPSFNLLTQKNLFLDFGNIKFWIYTLLFILITGLLAGSYPAFFLSSFNPTSVLKGGFKKVNALVTPRKVLVIAQFSFAICLIICTFIIKEQITYAKQRESGYNRNRLVFVYTVGDINKNYTLIKNALLQSGAVTAVSRTMAPLTQNWSSGYSLSWHGKDPNAKIDFNRFSADGNLTKVAGIKFLQGRDIDLTNFPTDSSACLINETAMRIMGFKNPIGQIISDYPDDWHVVGVIKDFIQESPYAPIKPMIIKGPKYGGNVLHFKLAENKPITKSLAAIESIFKQYNPAFPFDYHFIDEDYERKFENEKFTGVLVGLFSGLTVFISCLGLFGLAACMAQNRIKEIGVRKVLGASAAKIARMLSGEFVKLVILSILIASPIAYWAMHKWLEGFQYKITISWWVFLLSGLSAIIIAILTVSFQAIKAALANPIKALRTE